MIPQKSNPLFRKFDYLKGYRPLIWLLIAGFLLYFQTIFFSYTFFDDQVLILNRLNFLKEPSNILKAFSQDAFNTYGGKFYYRPVLTISFIIDAWLGKGSLVMFHITNILLHILSVWLLFLILIHLGYERSKSFFFALIFLFHPAVTQAVAWIPGRNDSLLAVFAFTSILFLLRYLQYQKLIYGAGHFIFLFLALLTKESAVVVPVLGLVYLIFGHKTGWKKVLLFVSVWAVFGILWIWMRHSFLGSITGFSFKDNITSLIHSLPALLAYIGKSVIPVKLSVYPILKDLLFHLISGSIVVVILAVLFITQKRKNVFRFLFGCCWFLFFMLISLIKVPNYSEHRIYMSLPGLFIMILEIRNFKDSRFKSWMYILPLLFGLLTFFYSRNFKDKLTLWQQAVKSSPSCAFNQNNLGAMYYLDKNLPLAEKYFRKAIELKSSEPMANGNLGLVLMNTGRGGEAEKYYLKEIEVNPLFDHVYFNLGVLKYAQGNVDMAIALFERTVEINPGYLDAYRNLIILYQQRNDQVKLSGIIEKARRNGINVGM